jgi:transposase (fragment)
LVYQTVFAELQKIKPLQIWLAMKDASKKWTIPIQNQKQAMNQFMIDFGDRLNEHR